jgi:serine/threonine protein kinase
MSPESPAQLAREIGNYELVSKIAEGGMGAVYKGRHRTSGDIVAIKIVPPETARNPLLLKRFEQEFRAASLIDHPNVVKAIEYCGSVPTPFLVMEYVDGESLGDKVDREGPLPEDLAIHIIAQVCEGLHRAHKQGLIHRDVKPDNILVTADHVAKLTDLGLVKDIEGELNLTKTGKGLGTPHFMAPEQFRNAKNADVRCDVYSLGATLYMLVTGQVPFDRTSPLDCWLKKTKNDLPTPKSLNGNLSDRIDFAIRRAMAPAAADRPSSCRELMEDLTGLPWRAGQSSGNSTDALFAPSDSSTMWYMVYYDAQQQAKTVKGTTETIRANAQAGTLGDLTLVLVSRVKTGPFAPLRKVAEFRDLVLCGSDSLGGKSSTRLKSPDWTPPGSSPTSSQSAESIHTHHSGSSETPSFGMRTPSPHRSLGGASQGRLNAPTSQRLPNLSAQGAFLRDLPSRSQPSPMPENHPMQGKTDPVEMVPLTDDATINLGTGERPAIPVQHTEKMPFVEVVDGSSRWWAVGLIVVAVLVGVLGALAFTMAK